MTDVQKLLLLALVAVAGWLLYLLAPVMTPFMIAALLAYLGDPLVDRLEKNGLSRTLSVTAVFIIMLFVGLGLLLVLLPVLEQQITSMIKRVPVYIDWLQNSGLPWVFTHLGMDAAVIDLASIKQSITEHWQQAGGIAASVIGSISRSGAAVLGWIANLVLIPVVTFYLLRDWDKLMKAIRETLPRSVEPVAIKLAGESDEVLGAFLRGQFLVMIVLGTLYSVGLWMTGLEMALLIGMLAGLVSFVPYLGLIVGIVVAGIVALVQVQEFTPLIYVALVFGIGQLLVGTVLTPLLVGDRIGLHPVAIIFAVLAGGQLFGFLGILLALPVAAVIMVLLRHAHEQYLSSGVYGQSEDNK